MASTGTEADATNGNHDHILRPRPRKPQHAQVSGLAREHSSSSANGLLVTPGEEIHSALTR